MAVNQSPMAGSYHAGTARTTPTASGNSSSSGRVNRYNLVLNIYYMILYKIMA